MRGKGIAVIVSMLLMLASCVSSERAIMNADFRDEYTHRILCDSFYIHDSVFVALNADTVYRDRVRTVYRDRLRVDTVVVHDTVYCELSVEKEKPMQRSAGRWWFLALVLLVACVYVNCLKRR